MQSLRLRFICSFIASALTFNTAASADDLIYDLTDLGVLPEGNSQGYDLSDTGPTGPQIVGSGFNLDARRYETLLFSVSRGIPSLLGAPGAALGTSPNSSIIVGYQPRGDDTQAYYYQGGRFTEITPPLHSGSSEANSVSDDGLVAGAFSWVSGEFLYKHAFTYDISTHVFQDMHDLFPAWDVSAAFGINGQGHVAGYHDDKGFVQKGTAFEDLSYGDRFCFSRAQSLNDLDTAVGFSDCARSFTDVSRVAVLWKWRLDATPHWVANDLGSLGGYFRAAFDINNNGFVVGRASLSRARGGGYHGFLWRNGFGMQDLNEITAMSTRYEIIQAKAINARNEIVATALYRETPDDGAEEHAVLLRPRGP